MTSTTGSLAIRAFLGSIILCLVQGMSGTTTEVHSREIPRSTNEVGPEPVRLARRRVYLCGVESYRPKVDFNTYNALWKTELIRRSKENEGPSPIIYKSKNLMVSEIIKRLGSDGCIATLDLYGHGKSGYISLGNSQGGDYVPSTYIDIRIKDRAFRGEWMAELASLKPRMCGKESLVSLYACFVGANKEGADLIQTLANTFGVQVRGAINAVMAPYPYTGKWRRAGPVKTEKLPAPESPKAP